MYNYISESQSAAKNLNIILNYLYESEIVYRVILNNVLFIIMLYDKSDTDNFLNRFIPKSLCDVSGVIKLGKSIVIRNTLIRDSIIKSAINEYESKNHIQESHSS